MDFLSLLDPKLIFIALAVAGLVIFVYFSWKKTNLSIAELENGQKRLQKQLAHGVITDERINPLRIDNASNMSDETMDYEYGREEDTGSESESEACTGSDAEDTCSGSEGNESSGSGSESHFLKGPLHGSIPKDKINEIVKHHRESHQPPSAQESPEHDFEQHYGVSVPQIHEIPGHGAISELRDLRSPEKDDIIIINDNDYDTESEEPIEFNDIDEDPEFGYTAEHIGLEELQKKQLEDKIYQDMVRLDQENERLQRAEQVKKPVITPKPKDTAPKPDPNPKPSPTTKINIKPKPKPKPEIKEVSTPKPKISLKPKIQPKIKI